MVVQSIDPHPLSAVAKGWLIPDEDVDSRRAVRQAKRASLTLSSASSSSSPATATASVASAATPRALEPSFSFNFGSHPDEEKGRSLRTNSGTLVFATSAWHDALNVDSTSSKPMIPAAELDDDQDGGWMDSWIADRGLKTEDMFSKPNVIYITGPPKFDWNVVLAQAVDTANGNLDLSNQGISYVPESVWELKTLRRLPLPPPRPIHSSPSFAGTSTSVSAPRRSFARTQSVPTAVPSLFGTTAPPTSGTRSFSRSTTVSFGPPSEPTPRINSALSFSVPVKLNLTHNELTAASLSNALFTLPNLEQLFLGQNRLDRVPEGIGRLSGLVSLSLRSNMIQYLPAEILQLENLEQITLHPNPFLSPPQIDKSKSDSSETEVDSIPPRLLGPLRVHFAVPSLLETMNRYLLSPSTRPTRSNPNPPLRISGWERPDNFPDSLVEPFLSTPFPTSCTSSRRERTISSASTSSEWSVASTIDEAASIAQQPFDPWANVCHSPAHEGEARVFYRPAVERFEWVSEGSLLKPSLRKVEGAKTIPILHRGCGRHCLDWLEE